MHCRVSICSAGGKLLRHNIVPCNRNVTQLKGEASESTCEYAPAQEWLSSYTHTWQVMQAAEVMRTRTSSQGFLGCLAKVAVHSRCPPIAPVEADNLQTSHLCALQQMADKRCPASAQTTKHSETLWAAGSPYVWMLESAVVLYLPPCQLLVSGLVHTVPSQILDGHLRTILAQVASQHHRAICARAQLFGCLIAPACQPGQGGGVLLARLAGHAPLQDRISRCVKWARAAGYRTS